MLLKIPHRAGSAGVSSFRSNSFPPDRQNDRLDECNRSATRRENTVENEIVIFVMVGMVIVPCLPLRNDESGDHQRHRNKHEESPGLRMLGAHIVPFWTSGFT